MSNPASIILQTVQAKIFPKKMDKSKTLQDQRISNTFKPFKENLPPQKILASRNIEPRVLAPGKSSASLLARRKKGNLSIRTEKTAAEKAKIEKDLKEILINNQFKRENPSPDSELPEMHSSGVRVTKENSSGVRVTKESSSDDNDFCTEELFYYDGTFQRMEQAQQFGRWRFTSPQVERLED